MKPMTQLEVNDLPQLIYAPIHNNIAMRHVHGGTGIATSY